MMAFFVGEGERGVGEVEPDGGGEVGGEVASAQSDDGSE